jgi:short-subunit dehydrogenase
MRILITGATSGIGLSFVKKYYKTHDITIICRNREKGSSLLNKYKIKMIICDLSNPENIQTILVDMNVPYDILINNAGIPPSRKMITCNGIEINRCLMVNLIAPYIITSFLLKNKLVKKVISLNSIQHHIGIIPSIKESYHNSYRNSKLGLMSLHTYWNKLYENVVFISLNPGYVDTGIWHPNAFGESIHKYIRKVFALNPDDVLYLFESAFEYLGNSSIYYSTNIDSIILNNLSYYLNSNILLLNDFFGKILYKTGKTEIIQRSLYSQLDTTLEGVVNFCKLFDTKI